VIIRPEAEQDIIESVQWYEDQRKGLGDRFKAALERVLQQIELFPESHRIVYDPIRRALLQRFPFAVYYRVANAEVVVVAVVHSRRDPGSWMSRV
jgi:plasmid stabilization system protein ParE